MTKKAQEKTMFAEHVLEVRHAPSGSFLDVRGFVADYVREAEFLPHWKIDSNVVLFRDQSDKVVKEGAFAGYRSAGYMANDPQTRNFFPDRAGAFWRLLLKNGHYRLPALQRFGARTKVFLPAADSFEQVRKLVYEAVYAASFRAAIDTRESDVSFTVVLSAQAFDMRIMGGPVQPDEVSGYMVLTRFSGRVTSPA